MANETRIYLNYLNKSEGVRLTLIALPFLAQGGDRGKRELVTIANTLYGADKKLELDWDNGHYPDGYRVVDGDKTYITLMEFDVRSLTQEAIDLLGVKEDWEFPYHAAIVLGRHDRLLYVAAFRDRYSPNWNQDYRLKFIEPIFDVTISLLKEGYGIYKMDDSLHGEINRRSDEGNPQYGESVGYAWFAVHDQHGNRKEISGDTMERVFRTYADNYTDYQSYRRPQASEWVINDPTIRERYESWIKTAKGLKSSFEKFYGGAVVD